MRSHTFVLVLLLVGFSMAQKEPSTASKGKASPTNPRIEIEISSDMQGSLPDAEILLVDPRQRKSGLDNNGDKDKPWLEIPNSSYHREAQIEGTNQKERVITVRNPVEGEYWLGVYGTSTEVYRLAVRFYRDDGSVFLSTYRVSLNGLSVDTYLLFYSPTRVAVHRDSGPQREFSSHR